MALIVYLAVYCGVFLFLIGCLRRIVQYARLPVHLRWELYPVPHEAPERVAHGGSYFETTDWWKKPQRPNRIGELRAMVPEMLFLKALWEFNRPLWYLSFLFHFGMYLAIGAAVLAGVHAALAGTSVAGAAWVTAIAGVARVAGVIGTAMAGIGAALLLHRRLTNAALKNYTTPADLFNLAAFLVTFAVLGLGYMQQPADGGVTRITRGLLAFDTSVPIGTVFGIGLVLAAALVAYIPFTHMAHFIAKYFTYHRVRWDDRVNVRGGAMEAQLSTYLAYRPTWAALHIAGDGKKNWAEIATASRAPEVRK